MEYPYITGEELAKFLPGTSLDASSLALLIADIADEIDEKYGPVGVEVVERISSPIGDYGPITTRRRIGSIVSIVEALDNDNVGGVTRTLDPTDYRFHGYVLERLQGGPNPARGWQHYGTTITYLPRDDSAQRAMAIVDVARLETSGSAAGLSSRRIGEYAESFGGGSNSPTVSVAVDRGKILRRRLAPRGGFVFR